MNHSISEYDGRAIVAELRMDAAAWWEVMHKSRRAAASATDELDRKVQRGVEQVARRALTDRLELLNLGLGRSGSLAGAISRRNRRMIDNYRARELAS